MEKGEARDERGMMGQSRVERAYMEADNDTMTSDPWWELGIEYIFEIKIRQLINAETMKVVEKVSASDSKQWAMEQTRDQNCKSPQMRLSEGLQTLRNECDYSEFLEVANDHKHVDVYIDHDNEPIFKWIQKEEPDDEEVVYLEKDVDYVLEDNESCEHEEDDSAISSKRIFKKTYNDQFLNKLCPIVVVDEDEEGNELPTICSRHDAT
ncbi:unnamed protein product [Lactuca saligna]|uniref:Uncharacterized protein n=1 Tax=Lactuca saligna TaxID=75948 RepID=A0AA35Z6G0_LACSI|nr:unnamed protein product [Lactuca saligna]